MYTLPPERIQKGAKSRYPRCHRFTDSRFPHESDSGELISTQSKNRYDRDEIERLLARLSVVRNGCDLDLLVFLYRHPRTLLTSEQIAAFVGRDMKLVAEALDAFIAAGLVERLHNPTHAARMYLFLVYGPQRGHLKRLLELARTRQGRHEILATLDSSRSRNQKRTGDLRLVKSVSA